MLSREILHQCLVWGTTCYYTFPAVNFLAVCLMRFKPWFTGIQIYPRPFQQIFDQLLTWSVVVASCRITQLPRPLPWHQCGGVETLWGTRMNASPSWSISSVIEGIGLRCSSQMFILHNCALCGRDTEGREFLLMLPSSWLCQFGFQLHRYTSEDRWTINNAWCTDAD